MVPWINSGSIYDGTDSGDRAILVPGYGSGPGYEAGDRQRSLINMGLLNVCWCNFI